MTATSLLLESRLKRYWNFCPFGCVGWCHPLPPHLPGFLSAFASKKADPTPVIDGGPFVPCLREFMEHLDLVDCYIWVDDLQLYPHLDEQTPPKYLIGRVFDLLHLRELQGSLKIQLGTKILFQQCGDKMLVPPEGEIYEAIERWHAIP